MIFYENFRNETKKIKGCTYKNANISPDMCPSVSN